MDRSDQDLEQRIKDAGCNAPRLSPADIERVIVDVSYTTMPSGKAMVCEITLVNGFTVRGESAVVFIENNVPQTGREIARENAVNQIWQLLGYELRSKFADKMECTCGPNEGCSRCPPRGIA